jgi:putative membrane protein
MTVLRDPSVLAIILVSAVWYWRGSPRPRLEVVARGRRRHGVPWRPACFGAGLVVIVAALDSPLERLADDFFWAHMLQHVLLMMVAAPLIALGAPWMPFWRPLPLAWRRRVARTLVKRPSLAWLRRVALPVASPWGAWILFDVDLGLWHVPALYDLTLRNTAVHYAEHASFTLLGLLFWSHVVESPPFHSRLSHFGRVIYTAGGSAASWLLAVILALATTPLYPAQEIGRHGGISPLADQQLAAGVMLGPGSIPYAIAILYWLYVWLGGEPVRRRRALRCSSSFRAGTM